MLYAPAISSPLIMQSSSLDLNFLLSTLFSNTLSHLIANVKSHNDAWYTVVK